MPIIHFCCAEKDIPADVDRSTVRFIKDFQQGTDVWTWPTHVGLCIEEREHNGRDDSDFYMTVWNEEKQCTEELEFATTRGWTYPSMASRADATPEVLAKVAAYREKQKQIALQIQTNLMNQALDELAAKAGLTREEVNKLMLVYRNGEVWGYHLPTSRYSSMARSFGLTFPGYGRIGKLLTSKLRSGFRKKLREQIITWLRDPAPKYRTPLSPRQLDYV